MSCMAGPSGDEKPRYNMVSSSTGLGYCYNNHEASSSANQNIHFINQLQNFEPNPANIYHNLTSSSMEMIGFQSGWNHHQQQHGQFEERPVISQGLSLSLSSTNPPTIGVNSFEVIRQHNNSDHDFIMRSGSSSSSSYVMIRDSKYLNPAQELLNEFCNLGARNNDEKYSKMKAQKSQLQDEINPIKKQSLCSLDLMDLHKRKTKLLLMLEEVDKRYKHYCNQMKSVVSSFEAVAGNGAATVYSALASRAMSRHFRCLKDGILNEIKATKQAMGEKDTNNAAPGTTKGETPRLRLLDQTLRQQRAFQQMSMIESHPWRPQRGLPERSVSVLRAWLFEHFLHPYPSDVDKHILARQTGLSRSQVSNWFINARVRLWKPMVEEMYTEELKEHEMAGTLARDPDENNEFHIMNQECADLKPTHDQLFMRNDSECLSSIINNTNTSRKSKGLLGDDSSYHQTMELDFSSYTGTGSGVSLTLRLQQEGGTSSGVNLGYPNYASGREDDHQEEWQHQYSSLLEGTEEQMHHESQTLPYRNLIGEHLLHDFGS